MKKSNTILIVKTAILTLAEIKAAIEAFDRGESNVFDALDVITIAIKAQQTEASNGHSQPARRRDAA